MNAPAKSMLKTVSILFIIFGAIATLVTLIGTLVVGAAASIAGGLASEAGGDVVSALAGMAVVVLILALLVSILYLILGIVGVGKRSGDPSKAGFYIVTGIILAVLSLISVILGFANNSFPWTALVELVLAILYIVGGSMNKKAVTAPPAPPIQ